MDLEFAPLKFPAEVESERTGEPLGDLLARIRKEKGMA